MSDTKNYKYVTVFKPVAPDPGHSEELQQEINKHVDDGGLIRISENNFSLYMQIEEGLLLCLRLSNSILSQYMHIHGSIPLSLKEKYYSKKT